MFELRFYDDIVPVLFYHNIKRKKTICLSYIHFLSKVFSMIKWPFIFMWKTGQRKFVFETAIKKWKSGAKLSSLNYIIIYLVIITS